jgi:tRNA (mo5U34)-methyltransferase
MCRRFGYSRFQVLPEALDNQGWRKWAMPLRRKDRYRRAIFHAWR